MPVESVVGYCVRKITAQVWSVDGGLLFHCRPILTGVSFVSVFLFSDIFFASLSAVLFPRNLQRVADTQCFATVCSVRSEVNEVVEFLILVVLWACRIDSPMALGHDDSHSKSLIIFKCGGI